MIEKRRIERKNAGKSVSFRDEKHRVAAVLKRQTAMFASKKHKTLTMEILTGFPSHGYEILHLVEAENT